MTRCDPEKLDIKLNINYTTLYSSDLDKAVSQILVERKKKKEQVKFLSPLDSKTEARLDRDLEEYIPVSMLNQWVTLSKESDTKRLRDSGCPKSISVFDFINGSKIAARHSLNSPVCSNTGTFKFLAILMA